jgi:uncharacterized protein DUF1569
MHTLSCERDKTDILRRLKCLRRDSERRWGRMSAHQMVCHLSDGYRIQIGERRTELARSPLPRRMLKAIALYMPINWPHGILTTPDLDQDCGGTKPVDFDADVAQLAQLLDRASRPAPALPARLHPLFGPMSDAQWTRWAYLHADHHLRQFGV